MIRNLNQVNFCSYGSVLPERAHTSLPFSREDADLTALDSDCAPIYDAQRDLALRQQRNGHSVHLCPEG